MPTGKREVFEPPWVKKANEKSLKSSPVPPPPPSVANIPPPPPPIMKSSGVKLKKINNNQLEKIEQLKSRPRKRPDWATMMKEIENSNKKKLKHVVCNDRSNPILTAAKVEDQFVFESEKANAHNELLKEIEKGRKLKPTKTNDRSKPNLEGLRKFRRQMTIEEQIQRSQSRSSIPNDESTTTVTDDVEELDDIDKIRDDLQSTKQLLALELRNKEAQQRENRKLLAEIDNLKAEIEHFKDSRSGNNAKTNDKLITGLKLEVMEAKRAADDFERRYQSMADKMDAVKNDMMELRRQNQVLERKLDAHEQRSPIVSRQSSIHRQSQRERDEQEEKEESNIDEMTEMEKIKHFENKELKLLKQKLNSAKEKVLALEKDKKSFKDQIKKNKKLVAEEKVHYRKLEKEVKKVESVLKDDEVVEEEEDESDDLEVEEDESESTSSSGGDDENAECSVASEDESAPFGKRKNNYFKRTKRHEMRLDNLKKTNSLLKTNLDRIIDQLSKQKEKSLALKEELDSFLEELE